MAIKGTIVFTGLIFDRWEKVENLLADLQECCAILGIRTGLDFKINEERLREAHASWVADLVTWKTYLLPSGTKDLSHLKKAGLLCYKLCEFVPITVSTHGQKPPQAETSYQDGTGLPDLPNVLVEADVKKFSDGGTAYVAWLLTYHLCEFFERHRDDKNDPFESRISEEFEMDIVSGLLSEKMSPQAIHLVLKALFIRD